MNKKSHFWFSNKQLEQLIKMSKEESCQNLCRCYAIINGKITEYTLCTKTKAHSCNWDDFVYLGQGIYHHSEKI